MSLLMEALKKAEQAKREAESRGEQSSPVQAPVPASAPTPAVKPAAPASPERMELSLEPVASSMVDTPSIPLLGDEPEPKASSGEALNLVEAEQVPAPSESATAAVGTPAVEQEEFLASMPNEDLPPPVELEIAAAASATRAPKPEPLVEAARIQEKIPPASTNDGERSAKPAAQESPARGSAKSEAPRPGRAGEAAKPAAPPELPRARPQRTWWMVGGILMLLTGGGLYYVSEALQDLSGSQLATISPSAVPAQPPVEEAQAVVMRAPEAEVAMAQPAASVDIPRTPVVASPQVSNVPARPVPETRVPARAAETPRAAAPVIIERVQVEDPVEVLLRRAYDDYQSQNHVAAAALYRQVLTREPGNRDALLGMAACAQNNGQRDEARAYYRRLLELDPRDSLAMSGLLSLRDGADAIQESSRIKMMLDQEPGAAHLHFSLGAQYVAQSRWAEAQQAFFQALRHAPENPDYAYNLAVTLDRLGQSAAALGYYRQARQLAQGRQTGFELSRVERRIGTLANQVEGGG